MNFALSFDTLEGLTRDSVTDVACPLCGPLRTARANRVRRVLRLYRDELNFIRFYCARCGEHGWQSWAGRRRLPQDRSRIERLKADAIARDTQHKRERAALALRLWQQAQPADFTIVQTYLRSRIATLPVLEDIRKLIVLGENDDASRMATDDCAERWLRAGREVVLVEPEVGTDLNDELMQGSR